MNGGTTKNKLQLIYAKLKLAGTFLLVLEISNQRKLLVFEQLKLPPSIQLLKLL